MSTGLGLLAPSSVRAPAPRPTDAKSRRRFLTILVAVNGGVPAALLVVDAIRGVLGVDGINYAIRTTGLLGLLFLVLALAVTPLRKFSGIADIASARRTLGLYAFFHITAHFLIFFALDRAWSISSTLHEIVSRVYLVLGTIALVLMIPLAVTSTDRMVTRLGPRRWKLLHRATYVVVALGVVHYYLLVKADVRQPIAFGIATGMLLSYRVGMWIRDARTRRLARVASEAMPAVKRKFWSGELEVARVFDESPDVKTFRLVLPEQPSCDLPFGYSPGQYLNVTLMIDGKRVARSYTIASSPTRPASCEITVKRDGLASSHLHDHVKEGDRLKIAAPSGSFTFTGEESDRVVLIAGGVGITPIMAILRYLADRSWRGRVHLVYAARTEADLVFREELAYLMRRMPELRAIVTLTREPENSAYKGPRGRITPELLGGISSDLVRSQVFVCGPDEMTREVRRVVFSMGLPPTQFHTEAFVSPKTDEPVESDEAEAQGQPVPALVTFEKSRRSLEIAPDQTLLDVAEACGAEVASECRSGICGQCKVRVVSGRVRMDADDALTRADKAQGVVLACQARALEDLVIDA